MRGERAIAVEAGAACFDRSLPRDDGRYFVGRGAGAQGRARQFDHRAHQIGEFLARFALHVGGHSVDDTELKYGLAVTGVVQKSYRLSGDAALLFNVAQAQRQAGHPKEAIIAYKAYLRENPETSHRGLVEAKIRDLEAGPALAAPLPAEARPEGDRLVGVWENPFEPAAKTKVTPSEIPESVKSEETAPVAAIVADSSGGEQPSAKQAGPAPVLAPATSPAPTAPLVEARRAVVFVKDA